MSAGACAPSVNTLTATISNNTSVFCMTFYFRLFTFYFRLSPFGFLYFSKLAHKYQDATDRYGRHGSAIACNRLASGVFRRL